MAATASEAHAGFGVQPNGQTFTVQVDSYGSITAPRTIEILVYLDELDANPYVWVSENPSMTSSGTPLGLAVEACGPYDFRPWTEDERRLHSGR